MVAADDEVDEDQQDGDRVEPQPPGVGRVHRLRGRLDLVDRAPPADRHVHDRHVEEGQDPDRGAPAGAPLRVVGRLARIDGYPVGVTANNPNFNGGAMDATAAEKITLVLGGSLVLNRWLLPRSR
jgi:hypothetical protein